MYLSRNEITFNTPFGRIRFASRSDGLYTYAPVNEEEDKWLNDYASKTGLFFRDAPLTEQKSAPAPEPSPAPAPSADDPWALVEVPEVRTNRQGIEWLMANKGERFKVLSRDGLVDLAARHGVSFPNLNVKKK